MEIDGAMLTGIAALVTSLVNLVTTLRRRRDAVQDVPVRRPDPPLRPRRRRRAAR